MADFVDKIIRTFAHNDYSRKGQALFRSWLSGPEHREEKDAALIRVWEEAGRAKTPAGMSRSMLRMQASTGAGVYGLRKKLAIWRSVAAAAILAVVSVSAAGLYFFRENEADLLEAYVPVSGLKELLLPDGTSVLLNSGTVLLYPDRFDGKTRSVYLSGEANFKVAPDKKHPFVVKTSDLWITALGTEFNVSAYPDSKEQAATLIEGCVRVECADMEPVVLHPGAQLLFDKASREKNLVSPVMDDVTAWQRGELVLRNMSLDDIFICLERKYPYVMVYNPDSLKQGKYSFRFRNDASLDDIMQIMSKVVGDMSYRINDGRCRIIMH